MTEPKSEEGARSFAHFLHHVADGEANLELSQRLHALIQKLDAEAKTRFAPVSGTLSLTFKFKVEPNGVVNVEHSVKSKEPEPMRPRGLMFVTGGGNLSPQDPRQQSLPLREVMAESEPPREVAAGDDDWPNP